MSVPAGALPSVQRRAWVEQIMGMPISVHVKAADPEAPEIAAAVANVFAHLRRVDLVFSTWRADSDLLRWQHGEIAAEGLHPWVSEVVELCLEAEERTDGLFAAWRRREGGRSIFDPTGLVKGWAVAGAAAYLEVVSGVAFSIGAGGDIVAGVGRDMGGVETPWRIGIEDPRAARQVCDVVTVSVGAVATSGTAARGAHLADPRSGAMLSHAGSATVVGPDLTWADVWATAAFVDPVEAGRLMAARAEGYRLITH